MRSVAARPVRVQGAVGLVEEGQPEQVAFALRQRAEVGQQGGRAAVPGQHVGVGDGEQVRALVRGELERVQHRARHPAGAALFQPDDVVDADVRELRQLLPACLVLVCTGSSVSGTPAPRPRPWDA
jgi:hypothetical protein